MGILTLLASSILLAQVVPAPGQGEALAATAQRGREAMEAGRYREAIAVYRDLVKALPDLPGLKMNLGMAHYMAGQFQEAIPSLEAAVKGDPDLTAGWLFLGASQQHLGRSAKAIAPLQKYLQKEGKDPKARQFLGDAFLAVQRFHDAIEQFQNLSKLDPGNPRAWYGLGKSFEGLAARAFERLERIAPESSYWFALVAASRVAQKQYQSSFYFYRKALEKDPQMRGIHVALSQIYRKTEHPDWAAQEEIKELERGLPDCGSEKIVCDFLQGKFLEVLAAVKDKQTAESLYWQSQTCNQLALEAFSRLETLPSSIELHELMAEIYRNRGRHLDSAEEWKKALELSPGNPVARREMAASLVLAQDYTGAKPLVDSLLAEDLKSAFLHYLAGNIALQTQQPTDAIRFLKKALEYDPAFSSAHAPLGRAYMNLGQSAQAIPHLKLALGTDQDGSLHYQLAQAYRSTGKPELATRMLQKYREIQRILQTEKEKLEKDVRITPPTPR